MDHRLFEVKFEIRPKSEEEVVKKLGINFSREYSDVDYYLVSPKDKTLKMKIVDGKIILYNIFFDCDCFDISGKNLTMREKDKLLQTTPLNARIDRKKRVYFLEQYNVKIDFDYMKQFPSKTFLEIHSNNREDVLKSVEYVKEKLFLKQLAIKVSYDKLID